MQISFFGAVGEVTGSCHLLDTGSEHILLDCGMFQGGQFNEKKNHDAFSFDPSTITAVFLSHAHLDHTGRIPKLVKDGYRGPIYGTHGTLELASLIWHDAQNIMMYNNKKTGEPVLYSKEDIVQAEQQCRAVSYRSPVAVGESTVMLKDAGHIFGSAFIEIESHGKRVVFSGDMGNTDVPILQEAEALSSPVDMLICESTYGDRLHEDEKMRKDILLELVKEGIAKGGTIMMPAFSLERTQEILYMLDEMAEEDHTLPSFPIFLDSPLAIDALPTYTQYTDYYDAAATKKVKAGNDFFDFKGLTITRSVEESKQINDVHGPKMVIAGSGMMNGGRIMHHALRYLSDPHSTLILVGYQAEGTVGRRILDGADTVRIFDEHVPVKCTVKMIGALSAHADQKKLLDWMNSGSTPPREVCLVHGDDDARAILAEKVADAYHIPVHQPGFGDQVSIS